MVLNAKKRENPVPSGPPFRCGPELKRIENQKIKSRIFGVFLVRLAIRQVRFKKKSPWTGQTSENCFLTGGGVALQHFWPLENRPVAKFRPPGIVLDTRESLDTEGGGSEKKNTLCVSSE